MPQVILEQPLQQHPEVMHLVLVDGHDEDAVRLEQPTCETEALVHIESHLL